ncbi:MAG: methyltransferase domain-containing protein, partial [Gemmataceae bacterium]
RLGKVWSFLGHQTPAADQDPLAFARWCIRHADTLKPLCGKSDLPTRLKALPQVMADCPVSEAEVLAVLRVAQFSQVLNDLRPIQAHSLIEDYPTLRFLRRVLEPAEQAIVLDLGCSSGKHLREAQLLIPCEVVGLDIDLLAMQIGAVAFEQAGHAAPSWFCASITQMPFTDDSFSHVITAGTLSLLPIRQGLAEIYRILRPGGSLILTIEGPGLWRWLYDQAPPLTLQRLQLMRWRLGSLLLNAGLDWQANPWTRRLAGLTPMTPGMIRRFVREAGFSVTHCDTLTRHRGLPRIVTLVAHK